MAGLVSICCCAGGRLMSDVFRQAFAALFCSLFCSGGSESGMGRV